MAEHLAEVLERIAREGKLHKTLDALETAAGTSNPTKSKPTRKS